MPLMFSRMELWSVDPVTSTRNLIEILRRLQADPEVPQRQRRGPFFGQRALASLSFLAPIDSKRFGCIFRRASPDPPHHHSKRQLHVSASHFACYSKAFNQLSISGLPESDTLYLTL